MGNLSRRSFLRTVGLYGAGVAAGTVVPGCSPRRDVEPGRRPGHRVLADLHAHATIDEWNRTTPFARRYPLLVGGAVPLVNRTGVEWRRCHRAGVDLVCVAHYNIFDEVMSMPVDPDPGALRHTRMMLDQLEGDLAGPSAAYARLARNREELAAALSVGKQSRAFRTAVVHTLEGAHALGGDLAALEPLAARGVASITITHFFDKGVGSTGNALPYFPDAGAAESGVGLHPFGRELIAEMDRLGIVVDLTHLTPRAFGDALAVCKRPPVASHASSRALADHPYSLTDEHAVEIARRSGLVGVILYPLLLSNYSGPSEAKRWGGLRDVVRTMRHFVKVCGTHRHLAVGSDFGAYVTPPREMNRLSQIGVLRAMMLDEFGDEDLVEDVLANNAIDFLGKNWGLDA
jgi:membrane dipeptidase